LRFLLLEPPRPLAAALAKAAARCRTPARLARSAHSAHAKLCPQDASSGRTMVSLQATHCSSGRSRGDNDDDDDMVEEMEEWRGAVRVCVV
jgi:hypothetical protein